MMNQHQPHQLFSRCFPRLLHFVLGEAEEKGFDNIFSWSPDGDEFFISDIHVFMEKVAPIYFSKHSNIASLYRQLNLWGFIRVGKTRQKSSTWKHQHFLRNDTESIKLMKRCAVKNTSKIAKPLKPRARAVSEESARAVVAPSAIVRREVSVSEKKARDQAILSRAITPERIESTNNLSRQNHVRVNTGEVTYQRLMNHFKSPSARKVSYCDADPLFDEKLGYGIYLGQDFKSYMSVLDCNLDVGRLNASAIDTNIDFKSVFQM